MFECYHIVKRPLWKFSESIFRLFNNIVNKSGNSVHIDAYIHICIHYVLDR